MKNFEDLIKSASFKKSTVVVAAATCPSVISACSLAYEKGLSNFILVGNKLEIEKITTKFEVIDEPDTVKAVDKAVSLVKGGVAQSLMKGLCETSTILKAVLNKESGIRTNKKLSHLAAFEVPTYHKLLFVTDAAINISPNIDDKKDILENSVNALNKLGLTPKVALLAAKEVLDAKMPVTLEYEQIVKQHENGFLKNSIIEGPLALDNAISLDSCKIKGIETKVGGDVDLLFAPNIESGNILYKSLSFLANAKTAGIVLGAARPIILTSRSDSVSSKLTSIALSLVF